MLTRIEFPFPQAPKIEKLTENEKKLLQYVEDIKKAVAETFRTLNRPDVLVIDQATINDSVIGGTTAAAGAFTTVTASGNISTSGGSVTIGTGGGYVAGSIYSDANWGMIFRSKQASPVQADYRWATSADAELMRLSATGLGIGMTPAIKFHVTASGASAYAGANRGALITDATGARLLLETTGATSGRRLFLLRSEGGAFSVSSMNDTGTAFVTENALAINYDGISTFGSYLRAVDGSSTTPAYSFTGETTMGVYRSGDDVYLKAKTGGKSYIGPAAQVSADSTGCNLAGAFLAYYNNGTQVVGTRITGYTAMTGTADKATAYATGSITLPQLAERVKALQDDLTTHGLIGA